MKQGEILDESPIRFRQTVTLRLGRSAHRPNLLWARARINLSDTMGDTGALSPGERIGHGRHWQIGPGSQCDAPSGRTLRVCDLSFATQCAYLRGAAG